MNGEPTIRVLLIEDDKRLAGLTADYLSRYNVAVETAHDGNRGLEEARRGDHDVVLLDLMLPGMDGLEVCKRLREQSDVPIIMLTARGEEADRVLGLELGADDYVPKPYSARELLARIRATVRRVRGQSGPRQSRITRGRVTVDPGSREARLDGRPIDLTGYEFSLLFALVENAGRVLSRERLMELSRGNAEESFDRSIDVHISRLRQKLGDDPRGPLLIKTVRGVGYQFMAEDR
ncbi:MAG: response regulator transcription factor [Deltaproteobacteria bacterium]|nr:response regulator transcription factor [Deltaproteobacteria bacterium]